MDYASLTKTVQTLIASCGTTLTYKQGGTTYSVKGVIVEYPTVLNQETSSTNPTVYIAGGLNFTPKNGDFIVINTKTLIVKSVSRVAPAGTAVLWQLTAQAGTTS